MIKGKRPYFDIYIGRELHYPKTNFSRSKWANLPNVKKVGIKKSLELYEKHIRKTPELWDTLDELEGKVLGCWCKPNPCRGDVLIKLMNEKLNKNEAQTL